jgi:hypothetical protein
MESYVLIANYKIAMMIQITTANKLVNQIIVHESRERDLHRRINTELKGI